MAEIKVKCPNCGEENTIDELQEEFQCNKCAATFKTSELAKINDEPTEEELAFSAEEGIEFSETLDYNDVYAFNLYVLKKAPSNILSRILFSIMGIILIVLPIVNQNNWWLIAIGVVILLYSLVFYNAVQRRMINANLKRKNFNPLNIIIKIGQTKIKYCLVTEKHPPLINITDVVKVVKTPQYIYLHISAYSVVIIKLIDNEQSEEIINLVKNTFEPLHKYHEVVK